MFLIRSTWQENACESYCETFSSLKSRNGTELSKLYFSKTLNIFTTKVNTPETQCNESYSRNAFIVVDFEHRKWQNIFLITNSFKSLKSSNSIYKVDLVLAIFFYLVTKIQSISVLNTLQFPVSISRGQSCTVVGLKLELGVNLYQT